MKNVTGCFAFWLLAVSLLFSACYSPRYVHSPVAVNVPVLAKKGDSKIAGYYSFNPGEKPNQTTAGKLSSGNGLDIQAAYALTNHLAVQAAFNVRNEKNYADFNINRADSSLISYKRNSIEFGLGYFTYFDKRRASFFQVFAGAGFGSSSFSDKYFTGNMPARNFKMDVTRLYIQPAILIKYGEVFASSLSSRVSLVYFKNVQSDYTAEELFRYQLKDIQKGAKVFWEPAFTNTFGLKKLPGLKLELQMGLAFLMSDRFVDYRTLNISAGLLLDIPAFFDKKDPEKN
ncbi:MAG TPA: hypothetical protein PLY34_07770 [Ferruginibacter sp.]|nr:hypothetical protein [Ferruginibacter sp.]